MRIAICFSGQPRFVRECYRGIRENIIDENKNYEIDVFAHTWFSEDLADKVLYHNEFSSFSGNAKINKNSIGDIINLYNPKEIIVDEPIEFLSLASYEGSFNRQIDSVNKMGIEKEEYIKMKLNSHYSFLYSIMQSNIIKKKYELKKGFVYDWVVKLRFDNIIKSPISFSNLDPNFLYHQEMGKGESEISDWINFSSSKNMDSFSSAFHTIERLIDSNNDKYGWFSPESILKECCLRDNVHLMPISLNTELPRWGEI
jgi:hypothetical protein